MNERHQILKKAGSVGIMTAVSRVLGYFRDASLAWVLGAGLSMDAFAVAFRLANLFRRLVAEGAMSAAFVPVFVQFRTDHSKEELWQFARKFFYTLGLVTASIVVLEIALAPLIVRMMAPGFVHTAGKFELTVLLTRIMAPYLTFISLAAVLMGVLNSIGYFVIPALSPICYNLIIIAAALIFGRFSPEPVVGIAGAVLVGGFLQMFCQFPLAVKEGMNFKFGFSLRHEGIQKVGRLLLPSIFGIGIVQINLLVDSLMASLLREGSVSQLYYADRVMELVLGIFVISLTTVALPQMSKLAAEKKMDELKHTLLFSLRAVAFVAIPATVGLFFLADPITHVLFERGRFSALDTERTAIALAYYALGLFFISASKLLVSAFYALQDTKTPVKVAFCSLILNAILNWVLMHPLKQGGIALATSIAALFSVLQLIYLFQKKFGPFEWRAFWQTMTKILISSLAMGMACLVLLTLFQFNPGQALSWKLAALFGTIACGIVIYLALALILKAEERLTLSFLLRRKL